MGQVRKIEVSLSEELGDFVSKEVARGHHASAEDVITSALEEMQLDRALEEDPELLARLKAAWDEGIASGPGEDIDIVMARLHARWKGSVEGAE